MKVHAIPPHYFETGELLTPTKVNECNQYLVDVGNDIASKRYAYSVVTLPFYLGITGISQADNQGTRSYLIYAPDQLVIERMYLNGALASGAATVVVYNATTGTTAPTGIVNPVLTPTTTVSSLLFSQPITIPAGSTYRIEITGTTFTTSKLDLVLHFKTDRYNTAASDTLSPYSFTEFNEVDSISATTFNTNLTNLNAALTLNVAKTRALKLSAYVYTNFTSGSDVDLLKREIPRCTNTSARETIHALYAQAVYASNGAVFTTVTSTLANAAGTASGLATSCSMSGLTEAVSLDTSPTVDLSSATTNIESDNTADYRLTAANSSGTNCTKLVVWTYTQ